jgi:hypothetical protein
MDACAALGRRAVAMGPCEDVASPAPAVVIYDAVADVERRERQVVDLLRRFPASSLLVLISFPRYDEIAALKRLGVFRVLGKPCLLDELDVCLQAAESPRLPDADVI